MTTATPARARESKVEALANIEIAINGVRITGIPTQEQFDAAFNTLANYGDARAWGTGDMELWGEANPKHQHMVEKAIIESRHSAGSRKNSIRRCVAFPIHTRVYNVSASHYDAVTALANEGRMGEAFAILEECEIKHLSRDYARKRANELRRIPAPERDSGYGSMVWDEGREQYIIVPDLPPDPAKWESRRRVKWSVKEDMPMKEKAA